MEDNGLYVGVCDVCHILDNDERQYPVTWCDRCGAFLCDRCRLDRVRRARAMVSRFFRRMAGITAIVLVLTGIGLAQSPPPASQFEVPCPANTSPLPPNGWTLDPATGKYRAWACVDVNGAVTIVGAGGVPGGTSGQIQFNDSGAFNGIPNSSADSTIGLESLTGDDGSGDIVSLAPAEINIAGPTGNFYFNGFGAPTAGFATTEVTIDMSANGSPSLIPLIIKGDGLGDDILDIILSGSSTPSAYFDNAGVLHVPSCVGCGGLPPSGNGTLAQTTNVVGGTDVEDDIATFDGNGNVQDSGFSINSITQFLIQNCITSAGGTALNTSTPTAFCGFTSINNTVYISLGFQCTGTYSITAGTLPTLILSDGGSATFSSGIINASINSTKTGTSTQTSATIKTLSFTGASTSVANNIPFTVSGTGYPSNGTAGTYTISAKLGGTGSPAGTINEGTTCILY